MKFKLLYIVLEHDLAGHVVWINIDISDEHLAGVSHHVYIRFIEPMLVNAGMNV